MFMNPWFQSAPKDLWPVALTALAIYLAVMLCTRIAGKRSFSKMSSFDFAVTVAIGSIVATVILSKSVSLMQGIVGLVSLYTLQILVAALRRYAWVRRLAGNQPLLLMQGHEVYIQNLKKAHVTLSDLKAKLREANVLHRDQVNVVVFESTGDISVIHGHTEHTEVEEWILEGVQR
jgi:uncharacterized membrane protein YcaP (DUF421 family)